MASVSTPVPVLPVSPLPPAYAWLATEPGPRILREALALHGVTEAPGRASNPVLLAWAREVGVTAEFPADGVPWCGLFVAVAVRRAGWEPPRTLLWARSWARWGDASGSAPMLGDVLVFRRGAGGHVAIYVGEDAAAYHCLGGNQSDRVSVMRIARSRLIAARRCPWRVAQPASVRVVRLAEQGTPLSSPTQER